MRDNDIPSKTQEGLAEIKNRALGLAPRMRTALLLVDGVKPVRELEQLLAASGVKPGALQTLSEKGLIGVPASAAAPEEPATPEAVLVPEKTPVTAVAPISKPAPAPEAVATPKASPVPKAASAPKATATPKPSPKAAPNTVSTAKAAPSPKATPKPGPTANAPSALKVTPPRQRSAAPASPSPVLAPVKFPDPTPDEETNEEPAVQVFVPPPPPEDMQLLIARAHVASALDDRLDSYLLKQMVASCSSRAQLESLFDAAEKVLKQSLGSARSAHVLGIAKALLHS